jgi:hypothetical protein
MTTRKSSTINRKIYCKTGTFQSNASAFFRKFHLVNFHFLSGVSMHLINRDKLNPIFFLKGNDKNVKITAALLSVDVSDYGVPFDTGSS